MPSFISAAKSLLQIAPRHAYNGELRRQQALLFQMEKSAGSSLRLVRSPDAPKITTTPGSANSFAARRCRPYGLWSNSYFCRCHNVPRSVFRLIWVAFLQRRCSQFSLNMIRAPRAASSEIPNCCNSAFNDSAAAIANPMHSCVSLPRARSRAGRPQTQPSAHRSLKRRAPI